MKINMKTVKTAVKIGSLVTAVLGVVSLAKAKSEEKQGDFSREFPDAADKIKDAVEAVKNEMNKREEEIK